MAAKPKSTAKIIKVTLKHQTYEIDVKTMTGRERLEAKRLLEVEEFSAQLFLTDEIGLFVLAYIAAKRVIPTLKWDDVLDLPGDQVTIDLTAFDGDDEDEPADPFGDSATTASREKTS